MPEVRFEAKTESLSVLDGYCQATGRCRTAFMNELLDRWAASKLRESIMVCRIARVNPLAPDPDRNVAGMGNEGRRTEA